jgi:NADH dehydrogenase
MPPEVVVLGAGYAGAGAIKQLERSLDDRASITWIADRDYHLVLHESHRCIHKPAVEQHVTIPVEEIKASTTAFRKARVTDIDVEADRVELADGDAVAYDYLLVALGTQTAFFGIPGLETHAHTLKSLDDAVGIHDAVMSAAGEATTSDPAEIIVGGGGLSGIQAAGEVAALRDAHQLDLSITVVEGLDEILPYGKPSLQRAVRRGLVDADVSIRCGQFISEVDGETVYLDESEELPYDVLVWTGGVTGPDAAADVTVAKDSRSNRLEVARDFQTSVDNVFAIGDCAMIDQPGEEPAPTTAQAAWQAAPVAAENIARAIADRPLETWGYEDMGTVVSIGDAAVASDVTFKGVQFPMSTFDGFLASTLKKMIAAKWIHSITGLGRALRAWSSM